MAPLSLMSDARIQEMFLEMYTAVKPLPGQLEAVNEHLKELNGTVARHEVSIRTLETQRIACQERLDAGDERIYRKLSLLEATVNRNNDKVSKLTTSYWGALFLMVAVLVAMALGFDLPVAP